jgi:hypothetical protein
VEVVKELIFITMSTSFDRLKIRMKKMKSIIKNGTVWIRFKQWLKKRLPYFLRRSGSKRSSSQSSSASAAAVSDDPSVAAATS